MQAHGSGLFTGKPHFRLQKDLYCVDPSEQKQKRTGKDIAGSNVWKLVAKEQKKKPLDWKSMLKRAHGQERNPKSFLPANVRKRSPQSADTKLPPSNARAEADVVYMDTVQGKNPDLDHEDQKPVAEEKAVENVAEKGKGVGTPVPAKSAKVGPGPSAPKRIRKSPLAPLRPTRPFSRRQGQKSQGWRHQKTLPLPPPLYRPRGEGTREYMLQTSPGNLGNEGGDRIY